MVRWTVVIRPNATACRTAWHGRLAPFADWLATAYDTYTIPTTAYTGTFLHLAVAILIIPHYGSRFPSCTPDREGSTRCRTVG